VPEYPNVKNAHIVPRMYLANWAVEKKIGVVQVRERKRLVRPIREVGTRNRFYRSVRPTTGAPIDDVEAMLARGEDKATPLVRSFDERWPLSTDEKVQLAELFAYQLLRGPRWKREFEERGAHVIANRRDEDAALGIAPQVIDRFNDYLLSDRHRFVMMFSTALTLASAIGSMHWTLIEFRSPLIATSDQPVVIWPGAKSSGPKDTPLGKYGIMESIEIRLPLSPTRAALMTWSDDFDDAHIRVRGTRDHARNLNAFTVAASDRQWFHLPETSPPVGSGNFHPLSIELIPGYGAQTAARSQRRTRADAIVRKKIGRDIKDREIEVVTITRPKAG
jgi:hypothetical protein